MKRSNVAPEHFFVERVRAVEPRENLAGFAKAVDGFELGRPLEQGQAPPLMTGLPLELEPTLELRRTRQPKPVEQRTFVQLGSRGQPLPGEGLLERVNIGVDRPPEATGVGLERIRVRKRSDGREDPSQVPTRFVLCRVGPEEVREFIAPNPVPVVCQEVQECRRLAGRRLQPSALVPNSCSTEQLRVGRYSALYGLGILRVALGGMSRIRRKRTSVDLSFPGSCRVDP
jgi:hypothetical protein